MVLLYGRAGRLTARNGGFRPGQWRVDGAHTCGKGTLTSFRPAEAGSDMILATLSMNKSKGHGSKMKGIHFIMKHRNGHLGRELGRGDHQISGRNNTRLLQENLTSFLASSMFNVVADSDQVLRHVHLKRHGYDGPTGGWSQG